VRVFAFGPQCITEPTLDRSSFDGSRAELVEFVAAEGVARSSKAYVLHREPSFLLCVTSSWRLPVLVCYPFLAQCCRLPVFAKYEGD